MYLVWLCFPNYINSIIKKLSLKDRKDKLWDRTPNVGLELLVVWQIINMVPQMILVGTQ